VEQTLNRIVECVPNFSEGRRPEVVDAIVKAITSVPDVYLLDRELDPNHNRAVITIAGPPESIGQAAFRGVEAATQYIDLNTHQGEHPRLGATDVVPFVPIRGVTLDDCVQIARSVGKEVADKMSIPVYLYESAATRPERTNLENIRRGQFEGLRAEIENNPDRRPDFGEPRIHPTAGAIVIGARKPLIAYNINLNTSDVGIAKQIAKAIRFSSGGFPYVKAMGLLLRDRNQAQVSMNLTDYEQTSIEVVFDAVRREAAVHGVEIAASEVVGLIPQKALDRVAASYLRVENFRTEMILENRLADVISNRAPANMSDLVQPFIERVASSSPVPGGGSVAALAGTLGVALGQMAIEITRTKKNYQEHRERYEGTLTRLAAIRTDLLKLIDTDSAAYSQVLAAYKISKDVPDRERTIQEALVHATDIPSQTADRAAEALRLLEQLRPIIHPNVGSDLHVGLQLLRAAVTGGIANMRINLKIIEDPETRTRYEDMILLWERLDLGGGA
jgi:glutamate formiminotransferase